MNQTETDTSSWSKIHHDLNTWLNTIVGYSELLIEECTDQGLEEIIPYLKKITHTGRELVDIVKKTHDSNKTFTRKSDQSSITINENYYARLATLINAVHEYTRRALEIAEEGEHADLIPEIEKINVATNEFQALISKFEVKQVKPGEAKLESRLPATSSVIRKPQTTSSVIVGTSAASHHPGRDILIVDDNPMNRDTLARYIKQLGHSVMMAENGQEAIEMVERYRFDLILLDIIMPKMDGYQVLEQLKSHPAWRDIPVIIISSLDEIDSVVQCIELGAEDYLPKPFDAVLLKARIGASLDKKMLRDQEVEYLKHVAQITSAAQAVENGEFIPQSLAEVAQRTDGLGQLARVFQNMAREIFTRELQLKQQVQQLRIELDEACQARKLTEITETEYFQRLQSRAQELRQFLEDL